MAIFGHIAPVLCCVPAAAVALMVPEKAKQQKGLAAKRGTTPKPWRL